MEKSSEYVRTRVANACDQCKARKVKCDGKLPCSYCQRRRRADACNYSEPHRRRHRSSASLSSPRERHDRHAAHRTPRSSLAQNPRPHQPAVDPMPPHEEETEVPREARLLCDAQGKLIFIGDCAPLSFLQTIRQLVTTCLDENAFATQTGRDSLLEHSDSKVPGSQDARKLTIDPQIVKPAAETFFTVTSGLVDLFEPDQFLSDLKAWAEQPDKCDLAVSAVNYLVLAIGCQANDESLASLYFTRAREIALSNLTGHHSITTVQAFILISLYMLGASQTNGAFLFFGFAVRTSYSLGLHRTEVNARFGPDVKQQRDRLWCSLRVVDLFLSSSLGRPPGTSDVDCTVPYQSTALSNPNSAATAPLSSSFSLLDASVQIFLIMEAIVVEVYSRKKISLRLTEGIAHQLRHWAAHRLEPLRNIVNSYVPGQDPRRVVGACQVLSSYYYAVMLVSRPFLMYRMYRTLGGRDGRDGREQREKAGAGSSAGGGSTRPDGEGRERSDTVFEKSKLADACIDAACMLADMVRDLIGKGAAVGKMPLIVTWLFPSSLVLCIGLLGRFGRILEKYARSSIASLQHFATTDAHALQYSLIAKTLLETSLEHLEKREMQERMLRTKSSSELFGLLPSGAGMGWRGGAATSTREKFENSFIGGNAAGEKSNGSNSANGGGNPLSNGLVLDAAEANGSPASAESGLPQHASDGAIDTSNNPSNNFDSSSQSRPSHAPNQTQSHGGGHSTSNDVFPPHLGLGELDSSFLALPTTVVGQRVMGELSPGEDGLMDGREDVYGAMNLFPLFEADENFNFAGFNL